MPFSLVTDPDKLRELGKAQLLWYRTGVRKWEPSRCTPEKWSYFCDHEIRNRVSWKAYALLLED